jgi:hypothetical protein
LDGRPTNTLALLVTKDGDWWVARGLERDIAAQAKSMEELKFEFERVLVTHVLLDSRAGVEPLSELPAAPPEVEAKWKQGIVAELPHGQFTSAGPLPPISTETRVA